MNEEQWQRMHYVIRLVKVKGRLTIIFGSRLSETLEHKFAHEQLPGLRGGTTESTSMTSVLSFVFSLFFTTVTRSVSFDWRLLLMCCKNCVVQLASTFLNISE